MSRINIVIPQNQGTTRHLLKEAGWDPVFDHGHPSDDEGQNELHRGKIKGTQDTIISLRSMDALMHIAAGRRDVGLVGSDCVAEKPQWEVEVLGSFSFGRAWGGQPPRLEIVTRNSKVESLDQVSPGAIFFTERVNLTRAHLKTKKLSAIEDKGNPAQFREYLREQGKVGIWEILGTLTVQIEGDEDFGVMVNESKKTINAYGLRVIDKIMDIQTLLVANPRSLADRDKGAKIREFQLALEGAYRSIESEFPHGTEPETDRMIVEGIPISRRY